MKKNGKKEHLTNLGYILLSAVWTVVGIYLTRDMKLDQIGDTNYFGGNALGMMVAWFIPGIACIYCIYREIKLLFQNNYAMLFVGIFIALIPFGLPLIISTSNYSESTDCIISILLLGGASLSIFAIIKILINLPPKRKHP